MGMQPVKVLLVDDHALFRQGVRNTIEREEDIEIVGEAEDGMEALAKARELRPDLILMDIKMPRCSGLEAVSAIKRELPGVKIIMLTVHDEDENLFEAIMRGAEGFLSKKVRAKALLDSLRGVMKGEAVISGPMSGKILKEFARLAEIEAGHIASSLTPREFDSSGTKGLPPMWGTAAGSAFQWETARRVVETTAVCFLKRSRTRK
jgi:two-component system NarL family response regulator